MSTQHTPGPWICAGPSFGDPLPRYINEIVTVEEDEHGGVETICRLPVNYRDPENEANARLIAAAPDMLAALIVAREFISTDRNSLADCAIDFDGRMSDDDAAAVADYDKALLQIDQAIKAATRGQA